MINKDLYIRIEFDPKGNPDNCNTFHTDYLYISHLELQKVKWNIEKAFEKKSGLPQSYIYHYTVDEVYIKKGKNYILTDDFEES